MPFNSDGNSTARDQTILNKELFLSNLMGFVRKFTLVKTIILGDSQIYLSGLLGATPECLSLK